MSTLTVGNRLSSDNAEQSSSERCNSLTSGHRACQGCAEALAARCVLDAAYKASDGNIMVVNATGCLEVFSCVYPENAWNVPWIHSLFGNAPSVATGIAAACKVKGMDNVRVIAQGGDGSTTDIGMGALSGMFDRSDDVLYVCYDNQAYMNTGVQRSSSTPAFTRTATTMPNAEYSGSEFGTGKNLPDIAVAHHVRYVATASVADLRDLERKVVKAINLRGPRYLHVHVPCPLGWGHPPSESIKIARLAVHCGLFPVFEVENAVMTSSLKIENVVPVEEYLKTQRRFAHLFGKHPATDLIARIQAVANKNIERYNLGGH